MKDGSCPLPSDAGDRAAMQLAFIRRILESLGEFLAVVEPPLRFFSLTGELRNCAFVWHSVRALQSGNVLAVSSQVIEQQEQPADRFEFAEAVGQDFKLGRLPKTVPPKNVAESADSRQVRDSSELDLRRCLWNRRLPLIPVPIRGLPL